jgi:K+-sensing histidine kinase KdpD
MSAKPGTGAKHSPPEEVPRLRVLAHDLSNSLEAIMQASYLLSQGKLDADNKRWAQLIDTSSQEAARINREIRKLLRSMSEE